MFGTVEGGLKAPISIATLRKGGGEGVYIIPENSSQKAGHSFMSILREADLKVGAVARNRPEISRNAAKHDYC